MKMIFVVVVTTENGKYFAFADTIATGNNLIAILKRYNADICHLCESRREADELAQKWNEAYRQNGTNLF
jgi:hypothetical protein